MADHQAGGAHGGDRVPVGARPLGPRVVQVGHGIRDKWAQEKNPNRVVHEKKVVDTRGSYKSEYTITKTKNKELQELYDEILGYHLMITRAPTRDRAAGLMEVYNHLMEQVGVLTALIKSERGMPLPLPKKLKKAPKPRIL